jgi:hypothetical protein
MLTIATIWTAKMAKNVSGMTIITGQTRGRGGGGGANGETTAAGCSNGAA